MNRDWQQLMDQLTNVLGQTPDINAILFLVGLQESGKLESEYSKAQKVALIQLGMASVLERLGYYKMTGRNENGWPLMKPVMEEKHIDEEQIKEGILNYFTATSSS